MKTGDLAVFTASCAIGEVLRVTDAHWMVRVDVQGDADLAGEAVTVPSGGGEYAVAVRRTPDGWDSTVIIGAPGEFARWLARTSAMRVVLASFPERPAPLLGAGGSELAFPTRGPTSPAEQRMLAIIRERPEHDRARGKAILRQQTLDRAARERGDTPGRKK